MFSLAFVHFLPSPFPSSPFPFPSSSNPPFPLSFLPVAFSFLIYLPIQRYGYDLEQNPSERGAEYCRKLCEMYIVFDLMSSVHFDDEHVAVRFPLS